MGKRGWEAVPGGGGKPRFSGGESSARPAERPVITKDMYERFFEKRTKRSNLCIEIEELDDKISNAQLKSIVQDVSALLNTSGMSIVDMYEAGQIVNSFANCRQVFNDYNAAITFGQHKGLRFIELATKHPGWVSWALKEGVIKVSETLSKSLNKSILPDEK